MGDADRAVGEHVDGGFAGDATFLGQQHAFGKRQHLHGEAEVHRNLHGERQTVVADVGDLGADVEQQRLDVFEGLAASADHHRQLALPGE